jgi:hypothetical protein
MVNHNAQIFKTTNDERCVAAAGATVALAHKAIQAILDAPVRSKTDARHRGRHLAALRARVMYPNASLASIARVLRVSKDTYAARLRRALSYAERKAAC